MATTKVPAECHSDNHVVQANFDAAPWLKRAPAKNIIALCKCGWGGDYPADQVAIDMARRIPRIKFMFEYVFAQQSAGEDVGYECHIQGDEARKWLKVNRPRIYAQLPKED